VNDAVSRFRAASEAHDVEAMMATVAPDAELVSPISGRLVFRGAADLRLLLEAIYSTVTAVRWNPIVGDGDVRVLVGEAQLGRMTLGDAMMLELAPDGRIQVMRPHLRPWLGLSLLALRLGPRLLRHPSVVHRALRSTTG
jgi:SnoaL-like domain